MPLDEINKEFENMRRILRELSKEDLTDEEKQQIKEIFAQVDGAVDLAVETVKKKKQKECNS